MENTNKNNGEFFRNLINSIGRAEAFELSMKSKLASAIITARFEKGMNQKEFSRFMDVSQAMVSKWESGTCNFSLSTICTICEKLGLVLDVQLVKEKDYQVAKGSLWNGIKEKGPEEKDWKKLGSAA